VRGPWPPCQATPSPGSGEDDVLTGRRVRNPTSTATNPPSGESRQRDSRSPAARRPWLVRHPPLRHRPRRSLLAAAIRKALFEAVARRGGGLGGRGGAARRRGGGEEAVELPEATLRRGLARRRGCAAARAPCDPPAFCRYRRSRLRRRRDRSWAVR
jgi:hypothetical protein